MKKISVSRLVSMSAEKINGFYLSPSSERKFKGIHPSVRAEGRSSPKLLCLSSMASHKNKDYYLTFDEVVDTGDLVYLYIRRVAKKGTPASHLEKSKVLVGMMATFFSQSDQVLHTVRRLVDHGYPRRLINLAERDCVFILDYNGVQYDIVPNIKKCLAWADAKMMAVNDECKASAFDSLPLPEVEAYEASW